MSNRQRSEVFSISGVDLDRFLNKSCNVTTIGSALRAVCPALTSAIPSTSLAIGDRTGNEILASSSLVTPLGESLQAVGRLKGVEEIRTAAWRALASAPLYAAADNLEQAAASLQAATTPEGAVASAAALFDAARASHGQALLDVLESTIGGAALDVGFIDVEFNRIAPDLRRVFATNKAGEGVAVEIRDRPDASPVMECEMVNLDEPRCGQGLAAFKAALRARGVHSEDGPVVPTGGVPESKAAIALGGRQVARERRRSAPVSSSRAQRPKIQRARGRERA